jgi:hypothetical protein
VEHDFTYPAPLKNLKTMNMAALTEPARRAPDINVMIADKKEISQFQEHHIMLAYPSNGPFSPISFR